MKIKIKTRFTSEYIARGKKN